MSNVVKLSFGRTYTDGGKARVRRRRDDVGLANFPKITVLDDNFARDRVPCDYIAPDHDCA
ncbi:hypothetical protein [Rhodopseudomonas sp. RCAM05734]|uniref:hypothetical protein n=1 Tax=Rhodopseudomonas sp. RCAM05734 TaxID=3457549 RepID=UPI004043BB6F